MTYNYTGSRLKRFKKKLSEPKLRRVEAQRKVNNNSDVCFHFASEQKTSLRQGRGATAKSRNFVMVCGALSSFGPQAMGSSDIERL